MGTVKIQMFIIKYEDSHGVNRTEEIRAENKIQAIERLTAYERRVNGGVKKIISVEQYTKL